MVSGVVHAGREIVGAEVRRVEESIDGGGEGVFEGGSWGLWGGSHHLDFLVAGKLSGTILEE